MNKLILILVTVLFVACAERTQPVHESVVNYHHPVRAQKATGTYANPFLIEGSSFGEFFQALYKLGRFDDMVKFTSAGTLERFGRENVRKYYEVMGFAYGIRLRSHSVAGDTIILNYEAAILATRNMLRMKVVVENDSSKIVLDGLNQPFR